MPEKFDPYFEWLGIASVEQPPTYYRLLGIDLFESDPNVIADAALQVMTLLRKYQVKHKAQYLKMAQEVARAKSHLVDPDKKKQYDLRQKAKDVGGKEIWSSSEIGSRTELRGYLDRGLGEDLSESHVLYDENVDKELAGHRRNDNDTAKNDGHRTEWYEHGQKRYEVHYENNETDFTETWWYENGQRESEVRYHCEDGKVDGHQTEWYENGQKRYEGYYKDGKINCLETWWHENGQKKSEGHFNNGNRVGLWTEWNKDGNKTQEIQFKDGKEVSRKEF